MPCVRSNQPIAFSFVHAYQHDSSFEHGSRWPWRVRNCFQVISAGDDLLLLLARCTACVCAALVYPHARARARGCEQHATLIRNGVWRVPIERSLAAGSMDTLPFCARSRSMYTLASSLRHKTETSTRQACTQGRRLQYRAAVCHHTMRALGECILQQARET